MSKDDIAYDLDALKRGVQRSTPKATAEPPEVAVLRELRASGSTVRQISEAIGVPCGTICGILSGSSTRPAPRTIEALRAGFKRLQEGEE